jgi:hypothetical protein
MAPPPRGESGRLLVRALDVRAARLDSGPGAPPGAGSLTDSFTIRTNKVAFFLAADSVPFSSAAARWL